MAASALRISVSASRPSSGNTLMPIEGVTTSSRSAMNTGFDSCSITFCATPATSEERLTSGSTTTNSSPGEADAVADAQLLHQALRHFLEQRVAHAVSERVVDGLEAVEV